MHICGKQKTKNTSRLDPVEGNATLDGKIAAGWRPATKLSRCRWPDRMPHQSDTHMNHPSRTSPACTLPQRGAIVKMWTHQDGLASWKSLPLHALC